MCCILWDLIPVSHLHGHGREDVSLIEFVAIEDFDDLFGLVLGWHLEETEAGGRGHD